METLFTTHAQQPRICEDCVKRIEKRVQTERNSTFMLFEHCGDLETSAIVNVRNNTIVSWDLSSPSSPAETKAKAELAKVSLQPFQQVVH